MTRQKGATHPLSHSASGDALIRILFDMDQMKPACVLLQAAAGTWGNDFHRLFGNSDKWLTAPTPGMRIWNGTEEQWKKVAIAVEARP